MLGTPVLLHAFCDADGNSYFYLKRSLNLQKIYAINFYRQCNGLQRKYVTFQQITNHGELFKYTITIILVLLALGYYGFGDFFFTFQY